VNDPVNGPTRLLWWLGYVLTLIAGIAGGNALWELMSR
jgi:hypothetical protein